VTCCAVCREPIELSEYGWTLIARGEHIADGRACLDGAVHAPDLSAMERDVLCHVLAEERTISLPLAERFTRPDPVASLIAARLIARPASGAPYLMLTEAGRSIAEAIG